MERISYHQMFMNIAREVSRRSTCCRKQVGSILVSDRQKIISCGWNGVPSGKEHCADTFSASDRFQEDFFKIYDQSRLFKYGLIEGRLNVLLDISEYSFFNNFNDYSYQVFDMINFYEISFSSTDK